MNSQAANEWLTELGRDPKRAQLHMTRLEETISSCVDRIDELVKAGETAKTIQLIAIEHRNRMLLDRLRKLGPNYDRLPAQT